MFPAPPLPALIGDVYTVQAPSRQVIRSFCPRIRGYSQAVVGLSGGIPTVTVSRCYHPHAVLERRIAAIGQCGVNLGQEDEECRMQLTWDVNAIHTLGFYPISPYEETIIHNCNTLVRSKCAKFNFSWALRAALGDTFSLVWLFRSINVSIYDNGNTL